MSQLVALRPGGDVRRETVGRRVAPCELRPGQRVLVVPGVVATGEYPDAPVAAVVQEKYARFILLRAERGYRFTVSRRDLETGEAGLYEAEARAGC